MDLFNLATAAGEQNSAKKPLETTRASEVVKAAEEPKDAEPENKKLPSRSTRGKRCEGHRIINLIFLIFLLAE